MMMLRFELKCYKCQAEAEKEIMLPCAPLWKCNCGEYYIIKYIEEVKG